MNNTLELLKGLGKVAEPFLHVFTKEADQLQPNDDIEYIFDGRWVRTWLVRFLNEDYLDLSGLSVDSKIYARVRK